MLLLINSQLWVGMSKILRVGDCFPVTSHTAMSNKNHIKDKYVQVYCNKCDESALRFVCSDISLFWHSSPFSKPKLARARVLIQRLVALASLASDWVNLFIFFFLWSSVLLVVIHSRQQDRSGPPRVHVQSPVMLCEKHSGWSCLCVRLRSWKLWTSGELLVF